MTDTILEPIVALQSTPATRDTRARPLATETAAASVRRELTVIRTLASAREFQQARELCAVILADQQPLIAGQPDLLRETLVTLTVARGFRMLARLAMASLGREVRVTLRTSGARLPTTLSHRVEYGRAVLIFDTGGDDSPLDEITARQWAEMIATGSPAPMSSA